MIEKLKHPVSGATAAGTAVLSAFHLDVVVVLLTWAWANLGQVFYMATLLVSSSPVLPITQATAAKVVGVLAALLLLKLGIEARKKVDKRLDR